MTERERWIVYPLIFFALGAALRDKFLQQVTTRDVHCERVFADAVVCRGGLACGGMAVLNPDDRTQVLVELGLLEPEDRQDRSAARRQAVLVLRDSSGQELCAATTDELVVRRIRCEGVEVTDPDDQQRVLAGLGSLALPAADGKSPPARFGVLALNNQKFGSLTGNPPPEVRRALPQSAGTPQISPAGPTPHVLVPSP